MERIPASNTGSAASRSSGDPDPDGGRRVSARGPTNLPVALVPKAAKSGVPQCFADHADPEVRNQGVDPIRDPKEMIQWFFGAPTADGQRSARLPLVPFLNCPRVVRGLHVAVIAICRNRLNRS